MSNMDSRSAGAMRREIRGDQCRSREYRRRGERSRTPLRPAWENEYVPCPIWTLDRQVRCAAKSAAINVGLASIDDGANDLAPLFAQLGKLSTFHVQYGLSIGRCDAPRNPRRSM